MNRTSSKLILSAACAALAVVSAQAEVMDRPTGIKIGQRMTLQPYVNASMTYDSNADGGHDGGENIFWTINPGLSLDYKADSWSLVANVSYQYHAYMKKRENSQQDYHGIVENIVYRWTDSQPGERGWSLMLSQNYTKTYEDNDYQGGHEYGTDRQAMNFTGALQRRFGSGLHADVNASYYWLDYDSNNHSGTPAGLYGWERMMLGGEIGYAPSKWTDFIVAGSYQHYDQDNNKNSYYSSRGNRPSSSSDGYTVQGGIGSFATERITYRMLAGWSRFEYGSRSGGKSDGFTYTVSSNWNISETWKTMLLATSYYQPTEREYGSSQRVDALSWGLAHSMVQGKLHGTFDLAYRHETPEYRWSGTDGTTSGSNYTLDTVTFRLGLNYTLNRFFAIFSNVSYRKSLGSGDSGRADSHSYDRYTATVGLRLTY